MGFSLQLAPSDVGHAEAGEGLWLKGRAKTGAVVGLYPGIVYTRSHYRWALVIAYTTHVSPSLLLNFSPFTIIDLSP